MSVHERRTGHTGAGPRFADEPESPEAEVARLRAEVEASNERFARMNDLCTRAQDAAFKAQGERDAYREALSALVDEFLPCATSNCPNPAFWGRDAHEILWCDGHKRDDIGDREAAYADALRRALAVLGRTP